MQDWELDLAARFPNLEPNKRPGSLFRLNGCGCGLYGERDLDAETQTYIKTYCICLVFVPVFALSAYRVASGQGGGWYVLGREPISPFARIWNFLFAAALLIGVSLGGWHLYSSRADAIAARQVRDADDLAAKGELAEAAKLYQTVALGRTAHATVAAEHVAGQFEELPGSASERDLTEFTELAVLLSQRERWPAGSRPALDLAISAADRCGVDKAGCALAMLDAIEPLATDEAALAKRRQPLLAKLVAATPQDVELISALARAHESLQETTQCEALLAPHADRLKTSEGARILGQIRAAAGKWDEAYALLGPYVESRLEAYQLTEINLEEKSRKVHEQAIDDLRHDKAPRDLYDRYERATEAQKQAMVDEFVSDRLREDPTIVSLQQKLVKTSRIVPVALDLGMIRLQRAQAMSDAAARRVELEGAEQAFLAVKGAASGDAGYQLALGEVYYWLGKQTEGKELFDKVLESEGRAVPVLLRVAEVYRNIGLTTDARKMSEEAYENAIEPQERATAAVKRALLYIDIDDRIVWLERGDSNSVGIQAELAGAKGHKAAREGDVDSAAQHFRDAIAHYAQMESDYSTLNNSAIIHFSLYLLTGDATILDRGVAMVEQALKVNPRNAILLSNAADAEFQAGLAEVIGDRIDLKALRSSGSFQYLPYLYRDQTGESKVIAELKSNRRVQNAIKRYERVSVISPKRPDTYRILRRYYATVNDAAALAALRRRVEEAQPEIDDQVRESLDDYTGKSDERNRSAHDGLIERLKETVARVEQKPGGATLAAALANLNEFEINSASHGVELDADLLVRRTEQARFACSSIAGDEFLAYALLARIHQRFAKERPAYRDFASKTKRTLGPSWGIALAMSRDSSLRTPLAMDADFNRAATLLSSVVEACPSHMSPVDYMILSIAEPDRIADRKKLVLTETNRLKSSIDVALDPANVSAALSALWLSQIAGDEAKGKAIWNRAATLGAPLPFEVN